MNKWIWKFCLVIMLASCSEDDDPESGLTAYDRNVIEYFTDVALGFEFGSAPEITRKWVTHMKIFVGGNKTPELMNELQDIVSEINSLATDGFSISIVTDSLQMNYYVFLGSGSEYVTKYPSQSSLVAANWELFTVYWDASGQLDKGNMYVDIVRPTIRKKSICCVKNLPNL